MLELDQRGFWTTLGDEPIAEIQLRHTLATGELSERAVFYEEAGSLFFFLFHRDEMTRLDLIQYLRSWHRGTREADYMIGGFFDRYSSDWAEPELAWFEALLEEDDVDVMAWALGAQEAPAHIAGAQLEAMRRLDYVDIR